MNSISSSPAESDDPAIRVLKRVGLLDQVDEFRAALITMGAYPSLETRHLAIALVVVLMVKAQIARSVIQLVIRELLSMPLLASAGGEARVIVSVMDGLYVAVGEKMFRLATLEEVADWSSVRPLMFTVFDVSRAYQLAGPKK